MLLPRRLAILLLAVSLSTGCGGGSTPKAAGPTTSGTPSAAATATDRSYVDGTFVGPGFTMRFPQKPKLIHQRATLNDRSTPVTFYDVTAPTYELLVVTLSPIAVAKGQEKAGLTKLVRDFWSLNGPAYQYDVNVSDPLQASNLDGVDYPSLHFDGFKKQKGSIWGQVVLRKQTVYLSVLLASTKGAFNAQQPLVDSFLLT